MSLYFPEPYDDEILYSVISRYHYYMGNLNTKKTLKELFGNENKIPTIELCCNINSICKAINNSMYDEDYLISKHTNLPFYYPFFNTNNQRYIVKMMKHNNAQGIYAKIGIIAGGVCNKKDLHYCPECVKDDMDRIGECYFHRIHQVPGVLVCPIHLCKLYKYEVKDNEVGRISLINMNLKYIDFTPRYIDDNKINEVLIKIARSSQYILNNHLIYINQNILVKRYKNMLQKSGLITPKNRIRQKKLNSLFKKRYSDTLLEILDSKVDDRESNWLRSILRRPRKYISPIRHMLLILLIYEDIESFINYDKKNYISSQSSWPCLNQVCKHYKENVITDCKVTSDYKTRELVGTFKCKNCGFEYSRKVNYEVKDDIYKIGRIKCFGHVWQESLIDLINSKQYSINKMAKTIGCDPKTIVKYARKLGKGDDISSQIKFEENKKLKPSKNYKNAYSKDILSFINSHPNCTRIEIRKALVKQYMWFYRNDKKWFDDNLPEARTQLKGQLNKNIRIDWSKRDNEIYLKIRSTYIGIIQSSQNIRITKSILGNKLGISALLDYYLEKLPKTKKYLIKAVEKVEDFQIRRVKKICRIMIHKNITIKLWKVMRIAGLRKTCSINVINKINYYKKIQENNINL